MRLDGGQTRAQLAGDHSRLFGLSIWVIPGPMEKHPILSDRALYCFVHGLSHLIFELGAEEGLGTAAHILERLSEGDLAVQDRDQIPVVGFGSSTTDKWVSRAPACSARP